MSRQYETQRGNKGNVIFGLSLIVAGCVLLADRLDMIDAFDYWYLLPGIIAVSGLADIFMPERREDIAKGVSSLVFAFWLYASLEHLWGWTFYTSWPLLLIAVGIRHLLGGLLTSKDK